MLLGYNTNGLAFHRWQDGLELLADVGYRAVAITVDQHCLNPFAPNFTSELAEMRRTLERLRLRSVIETGARFLLDPRQKHEPTLISSTADGRARRVDFLCRCIDIAKELNSDAVSFWSGTAACAAVGFATELAEMRRTLERLQLRSVIETGARFLLDPRQKHEPTLISLTADARSRRVDFLCRCIDIAKELNSDAVSFWSGVWRGDNEPLAWQWLLEGCLQVTDYAEQHKVQLAFEPEPGMLVETLEQYGRLAEQVGSPRFGLTIDIGHVQCVEAGSIADLLRRWAQPLCNVHIEDMRQIGRAHV